ncbi:MAG: hypothetical protein NTU61_02930 [Candidatus Altiarchaeota archaeon]|nr:hypothetical protein [Candidatus Altiarchaeota archaeon]
MSERLWSYSELKYIKVNEMNYGSEELADLVNVKFHSGEKARTPHDIDKIKSGKTIFTRKRERR